MYHEELCVGFIDRNFYELADQSARLNERILPIDLQKISARVLSLCTYEDRQKIAVGNSSQDITKFWPSGETYLLQRVITEQDTRIREERQLRAETMNIEAGKYFIDDVAVSGMTLAVARAATTPDSDDEAVVGLAFNSRQLRKRAGMPVSAAVIYQQNGGGRVAMNTLATFGSKPELVNEYALRQGIDRCALNEMCNVLKGDEV